MKLTVSLISGLVGALFSILLQVVPKLKDWWEGQSGTVKRLGWLIGCLGVPLVLLGLACLNIDLGVVMPDCGVDGIVQVVMIGGSAYLGGQGAYTAQKMRECVCDEECVCE